MGTLLGATEGLPAALLQGPDWLRGQPEEHRSRHGQQGVKVCPLDLIRGLPLRKKNFFEAREKCGH